MFLFIPINNSLTVYKSDCGTAYGAERTANGDRSPFLHPPDIQGALKHNFMAFTCASWDCEGTWGVCLYLRGETMGLSVTIYLRFINLCACSI